MKNKTAIILCTNAVVAALYVILTMPLGFLSTTSGFQIRPAEALTVLPALFPYTVWGLTVGCAISNIPSAFGVYDVILGAFVTLLAGFLTSKLKNPYLAVLPPILLNAFLLPLIWMISGETAYWINCGGLLITQTVAVCALGIPLYYVCKNKLKHLIFDDSVSLDEPDV